MIRNSTKYWMILLLVQLVAGQTFSGNEKTLQNESINSVSDAVATAARQVGLGKTYLESKSLSDGDISHLLLENDNTPFIADKINGKSVWTIKFGGISFLADSLKEQYGDVFPVTSTLVATIDSTTGIVLRVSTQADEQYDPLPAEPDAIAATKDMRATGEVISGLPDSAPPVPMLDALRASVGCAPFAAKEIIASYVLISRHGEAPRPVWSIVARGIPPVEITSRSKEVAPEARRRTRCVVDATTGQWLYMTNVP